MKTALVTIAALVVLCILLTALETVHNLIFEADKDAGILSPDEYRSLKQRGELNDYIRQTSAGDTGPQS